MKAVIQRVTKASVSIDGKLVSEIGAGFLVLVGAAKGDTGEQADFLARKISKLRIFEDDAGRMNLSILDKGAEALVVSQFTLCADTSRGNRPGFDPAMPPGDAEPLVEYFVKKLNDAGVPVKTGVFGAYMNVELANDGPVTIILEKTP
ncbi:MAG: D-tyrosyl-tRNA(Tyr) deacylase [Planctomycetota bacterium]|nr:MAG: D-tyrosyl-tRNA(Tyr) deacylase [Planctomycetota bacterium]